MTKPTLTYPVLVEGKYDKIKLDSLFTAHVISTAGFGIFKDPEKRELIRRIATAAGGIIVAVDSDGGGTIIRGHISGILPKALIHTLHIPKIEGKERRKAAPSKEGTVGLEGIPANTLRALFAPYIMGTEPLAAAEPAPPITKARLYEDGFTGRAHSVERRAALCKALNLPENLTVPALIAAINAIGAAAYESAKIKLQG
jgi:ribonuclease M5